MTFNLIVMGCTGGPRETNLSGYLVAPKGSEAYLALDGGTVLHGLEKVMTNDTFAGISLEDPMLSPAGVFLQKHLKAFLISHAHLDHIVALVLNSQVDGPKKLYGVDPTIDALRDHIFNGVIWPNYGSEGDNALGRLLYSRLPWQSATPIQDTPFTVEAFRLSHPGEYPSTAFLLEAEGSHLLYCGDTSADSVEKEKRLHTLWQRITPLIQAGTLRAIMIECSHPVDDDERLIFGHLNPPLLLEELRALSELAGESLRKVKVVVTHRKETLKKVPEVKALIAEELTRDNTLGIHFLFPRQGDLLEL